MKLLKLDLDSFYINNTWKSYPPSSFSSLFDNSCKEDKEDVDISVHDVEIFVSYLS